MIFNKHKNESGFSLVESIIYISLFVMLSTLLIDSLVIMSKVYKETRANGDLLNSAQSTIERMTRDIRSAKSLTMASTSSVLNLTTADGYSEQFSLSSGAIQLFENGTLSGNLTNSNVSVSSLVFRNILTSNSKAVRLEITMNSLRSYSNKTITIYDTVVLRGSYGQ